MTNSMSRPELPEHAFRRVAILFSGGPAPGANAVISTAAVSFLRSDIEVLGVLYGYSQLMAYDGQTPLRAGQDYVLLDHPRLKRTRNTQGIMIGTARANPGARIGAPEHYQDPERAAPLRAVYDALVSLEVDALVSIGGDDTLKTANKLEQFQRTLPADLPRIRVVHVPKTIDNDYAGIDFTFGYYTAVEVLAAEIRNLLADAESDRSYFMVETMGRSAGWLAYGAAIVSEASLVISVEDIVGEFLEQEIVEDDSGTRQRPVMNIDAVIRRIVKTIRVREDSEQKRYGVIVIAEGLAEYLPAEQLQGISRDGHGHIAVAEVQLCRMLAELVEAEYAAQTGARRRIKPLQLGYESRCARPHAFDVMLGSQLGVGAYRALVEERLSGVMVSVEGQLSLQYVPFDQLIDPQTLVTVVRHIDRESDFHKLARFLETHVNE